jgi:hypothetical protein
MVIPKTIEHQPAKTIEHQPVKTIEHQSVVPLIEDKTDEIVH